jgi:DNA-nicking Smr family endonuclease
MVRRRRGGLSDDDLEHWRRVARTATPLSTSSRPDPVAAPTASARNDASDPDRGQDSLPASDKPHPLSGFRIGQAAPDRPSDHDLLDPVGARLAAQPVHMDHKTFGRMKRGKLVPDRKLDLHGMTLAQAHPALHRFVQQAHADGLRLLLVVTGKGRSGTDEGLPIPAPRGILRQQVPQWLTSGTMRPFVLQVTDAHRRHGGAGAYYVYLRRAR